MSINPNEDSILTLKRDFFIENLLFHRARKLYFWMVSFLGKLTHSRGGSGRFVFLILVLSCSP